MATVAQKSRSSRAAGKRLIISAIVILIIGAVIGGAIAWAIAAGTTARGAGGAKYHALRHQGRKDALGRGDV